METRKRLGIDDIDGEDGQMTDSEWATALFASPYTAARDDFGNKLSLLDELRWELRVAANDFRDARNKILQTQYLVSGAQMCMFPWRLFFVTLVNLVVAKYRVVAAARKASRAADSLIDLYL